ncbi:MAG: UDP-glucose 4-epimerase GalE [Mycoplasma sp.]
MKILVAGGAGYIGSCFVEYIFNHTNYEVVIIDDLSTGFKEAIHPKAKFYEGSILCQETVNKIFEENQIDGVFHFAAKLIVPESVEKPIFYWKNNILGVANLLEAMSKYNVKNIIFSSTAAVYGFPKVIPVTEDAEKAPCNPYGSSKLACEQLIQEASSAYGFNYTILRYFNVAGASESNLYGLRKKDPTLLIPVINKTVINDGQMSVFGNDYKTTHDGTCIRDYIHIDDLVRAHHLAFEEQNKSNSSNIFNLGTSSGFSVLDVINATEKALDVKVNYKFMPKRAGDPDILITKNEKVLNVLNWKPVKTLNQMIESDYIFRKKLY